MPGFNQFTLPANDDGSTSSPVPLPFAIDFYGTSYSSLYVNNNGNLTMGQPFGSYTPQSMNQLGIPMIAPFWADVDTRVGPVVSYGYGTVNGHQAFGTNWLGVGCYDENATVADYFQVLLISRPDVGYGAFDIEFNYGPLNWDSGQASGGDGQCLNGIAARAGYTSGFGASFELPGSGVDGGLLSSNPMTGLGSHSMWSSVPGQYVFAVRGSGIPRQASAAALGDSYSSGEGTFGYNFDNGACHRGALAWPFLMSTHYPAAPHLTGSSFFACSGDTSTQLLIGRPGVEPISQLNQLVDWTSRAGAPGEVTVTIGGNDLDFAGVLGNCVFWGPDICVPQINNKLHYVESGAFADVLYNTYSAIKAAAGGSSHVVVVGYPFLFPTPTQANAGTANHNCWWWIGGEGLGLLSTFQKAQLAVDSVMSTAARKAGVQFIPLDDNPLSGHELCTGDSYFNALNLTNKENNSAGHPTVTGQSLIAQYVASKLGLLAGTAGAAAHRAALRHAKPPSERAKATAAARTRAQFRRHLRKAAASRAVRRPAQARGSATPAVKPKRGRGAVAAAMSVSSSLIDGQVSMPYSGFLWATGGSTPYRWSVTHGSLPDGLSLDSYTGILSGTPTTSGTFNFTVTATDSSSSPLTATADLSITVAAVPRLTIQTSQLADPTVGQPYTAAVSATGGVPSYTWAVSSGQLPAGLSLDHATGAITGTPTAPGDQTFTLTATDSSAGSGTTATATFTVHVASATSPLTLTAPQLGDGTQGTGYTGQLGSTGGPAPLLWSISSGTLPDGLSLDQGTGMISGIPTASGQFSFTAQVTDSSQPVPATLSEDLSITIAAAPAPAIGTSAPPNGVMGSSYLETIDASDGVAPYTWSVTSGALPGGLSLDPQSGTISGTPITAGIFSFDVSLSDSSTPNPQVATASLSITIDSPPPPPAMTVSDTVTDATVGDNYNAAVIPSGGTGPYSFAVASGNLPDGLSLDPQSGTISGIPATAGTYTASVQVTDSSSPSPDVATDILSITIRAPGPLTITTTTLPDAAMSAAYGQQIVATGGTGGDSFAITNGALPDGLSLDPATGIISGTPTGTGSTSCTVTVTDSATPTPDTASVDLTLTTDAAPALTVPATPLPDGVQSFAYSQILTATGGTPPYTWSVSSGALPDGLSLDPNSGIISGTPTGTGSPSFTVEVTDSASPTPQTATQTLTLTVDPTSPLAVTTSMLGSATQGSPYTATLDSNGGTAPGTWSIASGSLPDGLALDSATGVISGTPTGFGTSSFTVEATDSSTPAQTATKALSLEVMPTPGNPQTISFTAPPPGVVGGSAKLSATGGRSGNPVIFSADPSSGAGVCAVSGPNGNTLTYSAVGNCVIDANQNGNAVYSPAPQDQVTIQVGKAKSATVLSLSKKVITYGHEKALVFNVRVKPQLTGTPTGTITVTAGNTTVCTNKILINGKASCSLSSAKALRIGKYKTRATYSGSAAFLTSRSAVVLLTVVK